MIRAKAHNGEACDWQSKEGDCIWVDATDPGPDELALLKARFAMHPLALEDALEPGHWSRYEQYPAHDFLTFRTLAKPTDADDFTERLSLFVFPGVLLTISRSGTGYLEHVWEIVGRESVNTALEVAYELLDEGAQTFFKYIASFEDGLDAAEESVFEQRREHSPTEVFERKHRLAQVRTLASEALNAVMLLNRHINVERADQIRLHDVQDTLNRATQRLDSLRDSVRGLLDLQLTLQNQRMNEVMRTLAAVSTVFLPLTFLAGVWGMNYQLIPELHWKYGYAFAWGCFLLVGVALAIYFKRRRWW
ncbi:magnesium transporter CorA family protein [Deinococcus sp.]|uniref:magnesium transporter CorA family protein n=1 Tax=Deinococcus sp. TaxID=47478 RepID=UPI003CC6624E